MPVKNTARIANIITPSLRGEGLSCRSCLSKSSWSRWSIVLELSLFQQGSVSSKRSRRENRLPSCAVPEKNKKLCSSARRLGTFLSGSFIIQNERRARREHNAIQAQKPHRASSSTWWVARCDAGRDGPRYWRVGKNGWRT